MAAPSVRLLSGAAWALLEGHAHLQAFRSKASNPAVDADGLLEAGYAVFHAGGGNDDPNNLAVTPGQLLWQFQVTCVGQDEDQVGWVIDEVRGLFTGRRLVVDGHTVGLLRPPLGFQAPPPRPTFTESTERLQVPLQYSVLAVA